MDKRCPHCGKWPEVILPSEIRPELQHLVTTPKATVWLVERQASDNDHAKWWHPETGWMIDPNKAMRLCRREDAEAYRQSMRFGHMSVVSEHVWIDDLSSLQAASQSEAEATTEL